MPARSPFPGLDPWLESRWGGVHHALISDIADQLSTSLPPGLYVEVEEDLYLVAGPTERPTIIRPDVVLLGGEDGGTGPVSASTIGMAVAEPIRIVLAADPVTLAHIEIRSLDEGHRLVTAIEVFSPTNKRDRRARADYVEKREAYYGAGANVVELDLLRGGRPLIDVPLEYIDPADRQAYACGVRLGGRSGDVELAYYPIALRHRLPLIRVPLKSGDPEAIIDLQPPIDHAYARGRYGTRIDYTRPPDSPLSSEDAAWAAERVAAAAVLGGSPDL